MRLSATGLMVWSLGALCGCAASAVDGADGTGGADDLGSGGNTSGIGGSTAGSGGLDAGSGGVSTGGATPGAGGETNATGGLPGTGGVLETTGGASSGGSSSGGSSSGGASSGGSSSGGSSSGGSSSGGSSSGGGSNIACDDELAAGSYDDAPQWWAGTSENPTDAVIGGDKKSIRDATGIAGVATDICWANVAYAFGELGVCVDASTATSISIDVTSAIAGSIRVALKTEASAASSNHLQKTETFTAGQTKTITLALDGTGLTHSWEDAAPPAWDPEHLLQLVVVPLTQGTGCLAPYQISVDHLVVN